MHKRENIVSYLPKAEQPYWRKRLQKAYEKASYEDALDELRKIHAELEEINQSAPRSLEADPP